MAAGMKRWRLNVFSTSTDGSDAGHPADWAAKAMGTTAELSAVMVGPLPALFA